MLLVAEHYHTKDGRVNYRKFCDLMEHSEILHYLYIVIYATSKQLIM